MRYLSLFSGIEAASCAWEPMGWTPVAFAEIEPFPCSLLAQRWPGVPNLGDVRGITRESLEALGPIREHDDERHICPLQLEVIRRGIELWTNPGDVVLSPFAGIGSEGYVAIECGRRFVGVELKRTYYEQAVRNLAIAAKGTIPLFDAT